MQNVIYTTDPVGELQRAVGDRNPAGVFVVADTNTRRLVLPRIAAASESLAKAAVIEIEAGDDRKNLQSLSAVWQALVEGGATRGSLVVNVGGGMVTDLGGFAAATFKRGVRFINLPTTLLGAVDAAVGGKTGINFCGLKNEVGVFAEASDVIISSTFFDTLPAGELLSGYGEVLKHALLDSAGATRRALAASPLELDSGALLNLLRESVEVKRRVVAADPHENGLRKALNLGHTAAHAFEALAFAGGKPVAHGHAVAWGLVVDLVLSSMILSFPSSTLQDVAAFVRANYPAPAITCDDYPALIGYMRHDKKNRTAGDINFTLLRSPGDIAIDSTVEPPRIEAALDIFRDLLQ